MMKSISYPYRQCLLGLMAFLVSANAAMAAPPVIDSATTDTTNVDQPYSYTITATNSPTRFGAASLPPGLSRSGDTISGTPTESGVFDISIIAENGDGIDVETLELTINEVTPVITSATSAAGNVGDPFSYQITADNDPDSFSVVGLDVFPSLSFDSATGVISGTPSVVNSADIILEATNAGGTGQTFLTITVGPATSTPPTVISALNVTTTKGESFSYEIEATNDPLVFGVTGALPAGLSRSGSEISGTPTEVGLFPVTISATNDLGTGDAVLEIEVVEPLPVVTSPATASGEVDSAFEYQITADNSPTSFDVTGLAQIGGLSVDSATGAITGTPVNSGDFDVSIEVTNATGTVQEIVSFIVLPPKDKGTGPAVSILSLNGQDPATGPVFDADTETVEIVAEVEPDPGESLEAVFVRWLNPPADVNQNEIIVAELVPEDPVPTSGPIEFTGTAEVGFFPNDRFVGGGAIRVEAVATQRNADDELSFGISDTELFEIAPLVEILFPTETESSGGIDVGDLFASARVSTNAFQEVSATISGVGVFDTVVDASAADNPNGVFNFSAETAVEVAGTYQIDVKATDSIGNETQRSITITVTEAPGQPLVSIVSPNPGFRNQTFTPASFSYNQTEVTFNRNDDGVILSTIITYAISQITEGQGYFPRDADGQNILFSFSNENPALSGSVFVTDNTIVGGTIPELPDTVEVEFPGESVGFGRSGNGIVDSTNDPGAPAKIDLVAEFAVANSELDFFRVFVNGEDVTPTTGNLNPDNGFVDVPALAYPEEGAPLPGDYVVVFQVTDEDGEVGSSEPLQFSIAPPQELEITLSRGGEGSINQGESVSYFVDVDRIDEVSSVEFFDSITGESLGTGARVDSGSGPRFRFSRTFPQAGIFPVFAEVTTLEGQIIRTNPISVEVITVNDLEAAITNPEAPAPGDPAFLDVFRGQSITFAGSASSTAGVASFDWIVTTSEAVVEETDESTPYSFTRVFDEIGTFFVTGRATDNFENTADTRQIEVRVREPSLDVAITEPTGAVSVVAGAALDFSAEVTSEVSVSSLTWSVNGVEIETDSSAPFSLNRTFGTPGESTVTALVTDTLGTTADASITVDVTVPNPLTTDQAFVSDSYSRLVGRLPSNTELSEALSELDGTLASRVSFIRDLLASSETETTNFSQVVFRTMTGEWPSPQELADLRTALTNEVSNSVTQSGNIDPGGTQSFNFEFSQGNSVTIRVVGDGSDGNPLTDPTLTITDPNGNLVGFADDSFLGGSFSLNPVVSFVAGTSGAYTATVGGFSTVQSGDFNITAQSSGSGITGSAQSAQALVEFLEPEFEERFGPFLTNATDRTAARPFVTQVFQNKHGTAPEASALTRLGDALLGGSVPFNGELSPGYQGNVTAFVGGFAIDNERSGLIGSNDLPLSDLHFYSLPNDPRDGADLALMISAFLGVDPTDAAIAAFSGLSLSQAIESILEDPRYFEQFSDTDAEGAVALRLAEAGVFDTSINGPDDDADGDGKTNLEEVALGTDPTDPADSMTPIVATVEGSEFVVTFLQLEDGEQPSGLTYTVQCSPDMTVGSWTDADPAATTSPTADQTGVPVGYERIEFRIDMTLQDCSFVRVLVN